MTASSLRSHIANVLRLHIGPAEQIEAVVDALLADPTLAAIYDLAEFCAWDYDDNPTVAIDPEVRALLAAWRAER